MRAVGLLLLAALGLLADGQTDQVDRIFAAWNQPDSPGCAVGVVRDGQVIYQHGYGMASLEQRVPITGKTAFYLGSTSKQFTAYGVLALADKGRLSLEDGIRKYIPDLPEYMDKVKVRNLLEHTSGVRDYMALLTLAGMADDTNITESQVWTLLLKQKGLQFEPGTQFLYSNSGYFLLAAMIKRLALKHVKDFAEVNIFEPFGMKDTRYVDDRFQVIPRRATGYTPMPNGGWRMNNSLIETVGDGGVFTTLEDLVKWERGLGGSKITAEMTKRGRLNTGELLNYGRGLMVSTYRGVPVVSHAGGLRGFRSDIVRFPEQKFGVITLCNASNAEPAQLARRVADVYLQDQFPKPAAAPDPKAVSFDKKVGRYRDRVTGEIVEFGRQHGQPVVQVSGFLVPLYAESPTLFSTREGPLFFEVEFNEKDEPKFIRLESEVQKRADYERMSEEAPGAVEGKPFEGDYYCEEAGASFQLVFYANSLEVQQQGVAIGNLEPVGKDRFRMALLNLTFVRDEKGRVSGFRLYTGRLRDLWFEKRAGVPLR